VVRKDGTLRTILWNATRLPGTGGEVEGLLCIGHDITERRKAEQQVADLNKELEQQVRDRTARLEMANRELEAFSYSVSHDLKAPLRAIEGLVQALAEDRGGTLDLQGRLLLGAILANTQRMGRLIADLLAFSRVTRAEMSFTEVDMADLARSVYSEMASSRAFGAVRFTLTDLPPAWGDPALLHQVWSNMLSNALKFTSGTTSPSIEISGEELDGKTIYRVKDNGAGFDMEYAHKLFKVFQRLHSEAEFEGTGVGLALVQRIIHRHGGLVWAEGKPGQGAVFSFALPSKEARRD
jgi:light-regulated signal transduction histidine kinase (bacteriophytochrome)